MYVCACMRVSARARAFLHSHTSHMSHMSHMSHASLSFPVRERDAALLEAAQAAAAVEELRLELREQCVHLPPLPVPVHLLLTRA